MKRRTLSSSLAGSVIAAGLLAVSVQAAGQSPSFDDVPDGHVFTSDIDWLAAEGITRGCNPPDNTRFCPDDPVTRGQMAAFLVRALDLTASGGGFDDTGGHVFEEDISRLAEAAITRGCDPPDNTRFCPDDVVTRGQMAAFLVRALDLSVPGPGFDDTGGHVFEDDISRLAAAGVTRGCNPPDNTRFCPDDPVTRQQMAAFLHRAPGKKVAPGSDPVWFAPNIGSDDYPDLFTRTGDWDAAAAEVDVFKFYTQNVLDVPCAICGDNTLDAFVAVDAFRRLPEMGIATAIEVGAVKEWGCSGVREAEVALEAVGNVEGHGGRVSLLAMDEPYLGGQLTAGGNSCGYEMEESAAATGKFLRLVQAERPDLVVGDIEPYPHYSVSQLQDWVVELEANGVVPAFFHLDVDLVRAEVEGQDVAADLAALEEFLADRGIPFGVILTWLDADSDRVYYDETLDWTRTVDEAIGHPSHVVFQSWQGPAPDGVHRYPSNLPEEGEDVYSHTRLILDGLEILEG
ncbi:MAG: S-layer homology domain-containing protein [Actinomycetota bacterium]